MEKKIISINSIYRDTIVYPNPGKFSITLDETFKNITSIRLASIELPTLYYAFNNNANNTSFTIEIPNPTVPSVTPIPVISIPVALSPGNYDSASIFTMLNTIFTQINLDYTQQFQITWNQYNYTVNIANTTPFSLIFNNELYLKPLGHRLGFRKDNKSYLHDNQPIDTELSLGSTTYYSWNGESILDVTKEAYIYMKINNYGIIYDNYLKEDLFAKIIMYDQQFVIDNGANFLTKEFVFRQPVNITKFDIELLNFDGTIIDTNLLDFSFTLELLQIYDSNKYNNNNFLVN